MPRVRLPGAGLSSQRRPHQIPASHFAVSPGRSEEARAAERRASEGGCWRGLPSRRSIPVKPIPFREVDRRGQDASLVTAMEDEIAALRREVKRLQALEALRIEVWKRCG